MKISLALAPLLASSGCVSDTPEHPHPETRQYALSLDPQGPCNIRRINPTEFAIDNADYWLVNVGSGAFLYWLDAEQPWITLSAQTNGQLLPGKPLFFRIGVNAKKVPARPAVLEASVKIRNAITSVVELRIPVRLELRKPDEG